MKKTFATIIAIAASVGFSASALDINDYCDIKTTTAKGVKEMTPLADGVSYAAISDDGKAIETFSYQTGKKTGTLFSIDGIKGDVKISEFDGYKLSSNEKKIMLWNDSESIYRYSVWAEYYVYDIMRGTMKRVSTQGKQRGAVLSHDGRMVAYQRGNNIFISNLEYETDNAITDDGKINELINGTPDWGYEEEFGMLNSMSWSADDNVLVYMKFDESKVPVYSFDVYRGYCDSDPFGDPYPERFSYKYPLAGYNTAKVSVHAYDLNTRKTKKMDVPMAEDDYIPLLKFGGNGNDCLMVLVLNHDQNDLKLYRVNPASTVARLIYTDHSEAWLSPDAYHLARFGETSFVIGSERTGYRHLYEYDYSGTKLRDITSGNFNVTAYYGYDKKQRVHYVQTTSLGAINRNVAKVDAKGTLTLLHNVPGTESASFSKNFDFYVRKWSDATTPWQYTLWKSNGSKISDLELNESYAAKYAAAPRKEFLTVNNAAGEPMDASIIKPQNFNPNKKYPLVMYQYNGPDSQLVLNSWGITGEYYLASQGYIVATVDGRGTGNRSRQWANAVYKDLGHYETLDQIAGARELMKFSYIDTSNTACWGWSYGGYMTLRELTEPGSPFKAGAAMAAVTDWRYYDAIYTERYMLTPQQNQSGYEASSTLNRTQNLNARLLIMSGTSDDNVHYYNTLKFTSKIGYEGKVFDMLSFTNFEHSLRMCNARTQLYARLLDFLNANLKN